MLQRSACMLGLLALLGCSQQGNVAAPSSEQAPYAESYPEMLSTVRSRLVDDERWVRDQFKPLAELPTKLGKTDFGQVHAVIEQADAEGRSGAYLEEAERTRAVQSFFQEEQQPLRQKVAGSVNYTAKEKQCSEDLGTVAAAAMERSVEKQLSERRREQSATHRYLETHADAIGKSNLQRLEQQAEMVARMSYLVRLGLPSDARRLQTLLDEESAIRSTLQKTSEQADEELTQPKLKPERSKQLQAARKRSQQAQTQLDAELEPSRSLAQQLEEKLPQLERDYEAALSAVLDDLQARAKAQPAP